MTNFEDAIAKRPRVQLIDEPTPIQRLHRVEEALGDVLNGTRLFVKRDDLMGLGGGGNKLRKLEFLLGDAAGQGADTIITVGGRQSNHARLTAAAAARLGLKCELFLTRVVPRNDEEYVQGGNVLLDDLFGADIHDLPGTANALDHANARAEVLRVNGRNAYVAPSGGSSPIGCLGYAACAHEIIEQSRSLGVDFARVVIPNGSSGTHAGLAAGFAALGLTPAIVKSFSVLASEADTRQATVDKTRATLALLNEQAQLDEADIDIAGDQRGAGYGVPTASMIEAVRVMAAREGLLLDPVYSGKAFAGLLAGIRGGHYQPGQNVLFIMTGGTPGLFAYRRSLESAHAQPQ